MNAVLHALRSQPLFKGLWLVTLQTLSKNATLIELSKGQVVYRQGDLADAIFVVVSGRLHATLSDGNHIVETYGPESTFGERALFTGDPHWTTVIVATDAKLVRLDVQSVHRAMQRSSLLARELAARMGQHLRKVSRMTESHRGAHISALATVSPIVDMSALTAEMATMLHAETGRKVFLLQALYDQGHPSLDDLMSQPVSTSRISRWLETLTPWREGVYRMTLHMGSHPSEAARVAPMLAHLSSRFEEVLILCDARTGSPALLEFLLQSDRAYLLTQSDEFQLQQARNIIHLLSSQPDRGRHAKVKTIVCVKEGEANPSVDAMQAKLGQEPVRFLQDIPQSEAIAGGHITSRHREQLRSLSREIGHCRIGLVLSAGGARGLAHVGVIQVLEENGIHIDAVAGTSIGALVGALWCAGKNGIQLEEIARRLEHPRILFKMIDPIFPPRTGFMKGGFIKTLMLKELGNAHFSDLIRPLRIVCSDIDTLERIVIDSGELWAAVLASASIPGLITPFHYLDRNLVDGGISDPLPVDVLSEMGIENVIAVNTIPNPEDISACRMSLKKPPVAGNRRKPGRFGRTLNRHLNYFAEGNVLDIIMKSVQGAGCRLAQNASHQAEVVLKPILCDGTFHDFSHPGRYIEIGRRVALEHLDDIRALSKPSINLASREEANHVLEPVK